MTTDDSQQPPNNNMPEAELDAFRTAANAARLEDAPALSEAQSSKDVFRSRKLVPRPSATPSPEPPPPQDTLRGLIFGATMSVLGGTAAFAIVASIVLAIIVPPWYRSLEPRYQAIWCNRVAVLCDLKEERDTEDVYALSSEQAEAAAAAAQALLQETATPAPTLTPTTIPVTTQSSPTASSKGAADVTSDLPTITPTHVPTATPTFTPTATPIPLPQLASLQLDNLTWEQQRWNNCGPTTITIGLTYFGYTNNQTRAADFLKPDVEDTNVSPNQMVDFVNSSVSRELGVKALYRVGGTAELLKLLVSNDFPVIVERGIVLQEEGWMGHYSLVVGYDKPAEEYLLFDSWYGYARGEGRRFNMSFIEDGWRQFNHTFIVIYEANREQELLRLMGAHADYLGAARLARDNALAEVRSNPDDAWAWFNLGTAYTMLGNYREAANAYDYWRTLDHPFRMLWYQFGPYQAYYNLGRYDDVLALALASERTTPYVEEVYYYRGMVYAAQGNANSAVFQFDRALDFNENFTPAIEAKQAVLQGRFSPPITG